MSNSVENNATYVLFGDEAVSIYRVSIKQLLRTNGIDYTVGEYESVKEFFKEKEKWRKYIEIDYADYHTIKLHLELKTGIRKKRKNRFSIFNLFR